MNTRGPCVARWASPSLLSGEQPGKGLSRVLNMGILTDPKECFLKKSLETRTKISV